MALRQMQQRPASKWLGVRTLDSRQSDNRQSCKRRLDSRFSKTEQLWPMELRAPPSLPPQSQPQQWSPPQPQASATTRTLPTLTRRPRKPSNTPPLLVSRLHTQQLPPHPLEHRCRRPLECLSRLLLRLRGPTQPLLLMRHHQALLMELMWAIALLLRWVTASHRPLLDIPLLECLCLPPMALFRLLPRQLKSLQRLSLFLRHTRLHQGQLPLVLRPPPQRPVLA